METIDNTIFDCLFETEIEKFHREQNEKDEDKDFIKDKLK